jgi:predicted kinase
MRTLIVTRGAPGCGKSTFIKNHGWEPYTLSADNIRLLFESPHMNHKGGYECISQKNDKRVWNLLFELLEERMGRGEFCVIDATHSKSQDFTKYKKMIEKHRYRAFCIDFSNITLDECKKRNSMRESYKHVPEDVIENIYSRLHTQEVPKYFRLIDYNDNEAIDNILNYNPIDVNQYDKIICFGDIHGCYEPLKEYFEKNPYSENNLYIFTGDYIDRGIQNKEVIEWLLNHYFKSNVWLLQGNHEKWLINYANGEYDEELKIGIKNKCRSDEFFKNTSKQLECFNKKDLRELCRRFRQIAYINYNEKYFLISHAGIGYLPKDLSKIASYTFIHSNGKYEDEIDEWWEKNEGIKNPNIYQIHAHRNIQKLSIHPFEHSFNLCDNVEFGGDLRILEIIKNSVK